MTEHTELPTNGGETASPGAMLRKLREAAGLSLATVGQALHLTVHYVKALESDEYGKLPGLTFVKGYLRSYARFLKADVDAVILCFDQHIATMVDAGIRTGAVQRSRRRHDQALRWAIATGVIIVAGLAGGWWYTSGAGDAPATAVVGNLPAASAVNPAPAATNATAGQRPAPTAAATPRSPAPLVVPVSNGAPPPAAVTAITAESTIPGAGSAASATTGATDPLLTQKVVTEGVTLAGNQASAASLPAAEETQSLASLEPVAGSDIPNPGTTAPDPLLATSSAQTAAPGEAAAVTLGEPVTTAPPAAVSSNTAADNLSIVPGADGGRQLTLAGTGDDVLQIDFNGNSWVEIDNGGGVRLYNAMQRPGDTLTVHGEAPFHILLGDARLVQVTLNAVSVDIAADVRPDSTARLVLGEVVAPLSGVSD